MFHAFIEAQVCSNYSINCPSEDLLHAHEEIKLCRRADYSITDSDCGVGQNDGTEILDEFIWVEAVTTKRKPNASLVKCGSNKDKFIACIYISPPASKKHFLKNYDEMMSFQNTMEITCFIPGDMNID